MKLDKMLRELKLLTTYADRERARKYMIELLIEYAKNEEIKELCELIMEP